MLLAQFVGGSIAYYAMVIILLAAVIGIVIVITRQMGVAIPPFIITVLWIILAAIVGILAIKFIAGMF